jgi:uncharacterized protein (DUF2236 family)
MSEADLIEAIGRFDSELVVTNRTREVVRFIQYPPLPWLARAIYRLLFAAAVQTLEPRYRELLDLQTLPSWFVKPTTRALLKIMRAAIGPESPIEDAAKARLKKIGAWQPPS